MRHGRLYRFECPSCGCEYVAVGAEDDPEAMAMARAEGWSDAGNTGNFWYCPDCTWDGDDETAG